ncbi:hypothetical protein D3C78_916930 [compost metagenome]
MGSEKLRAEAVVHPPALEQQSGDPVLFPVRHADLAQRALLLLVLVDVLAEQLAGDQEGAPRVEEGDEHILIGADHVAGHVGLGEQSRLEGVGELLTISVRQLEAEHGVDGLGVIVHRAADQIYPREVDVEGDQAWPHAGLASEAVLRRDSAAQRGQLRTIGQRI